MTVFQVNYTNLNPEKALIWRILHRANLSWVLQNGIHCGNSQVRYPEWVSIGNTELIDKRATRPIPGSPGKPWETMFRSTSRRSR